MTTQKTFRVVCTSLNIRSHPAISNQYLTGNNLQGGNEIVVDANAWCEAEGYVWWCHPAGWSAERSISGSQRFMVDLTPGIPREEPGLGIAGGPSLDVTDGFWWPIGKRENLDGWFASGYTFLTPVDGQYHPGVDFNDWGGCDHDWGAPVYAIANGKVVYARSAGHTWGNIALIKHTLPDGTPVWSQYAHLKDLATKKDASVRRGDQIGTVGKGGWKCAHLHFEIRKTDLAADSWNISNINVVRSNYHDPMIFIRQHFAQAGPPVDPKTVKNTIQLYSNQDVINAFYAVFGDETDPWGKLADAGLTHLTDARDEPYQGPDIMNLPKLSKDEKEKILEALQTPPVHR